MPTYQNNQDVITLFTGPHGESFHIPPGETIEVPFYISDANFTKILDTPLPNRATATTSVTLSSTAADHDLNSATRTFLICQITGTVTVRPQLDSAVPLLLDWTSDDPIVKFDLDDFPCEKLRMSGSGTCTVLEHAY